MDSSPPRLRVLTFEQPSKLAPEMVAGSTCLCGYVCECGYGLAEVAERVKRGVRPSQPIPFKHAA